MRNSFFLIGLTLLLLGCGGGTTGPQISVLENAWNTFESGQYSAAKEIFSDIYDEASSDTTLTAQAQCGLGWCEGELGNYSAAVSAFSQSLAADSALTNSAAGIALAYEAQGISLANTSAYTNAVSYGEALLSTDPYYEFSHNESINARTIKLMIAWCSAHLDELATAQTYLDEVLPGNGLSSDDESTWQVNGTAYSSYKQALIQYIGWLRQG